MSDPEYFRDGNEPVEPAELPKAVEPVEVEMDYSPPEHPMKRWTGSLRDVPQTRPKAHWSLTLRWPFIRRVLY